MPKDIREILKEQQEVEVKLSQNHRANFQDRLTKELHTGSSKKKSYQWLYIAASIVLLVGLGIQFYPTKDIGSIQPNDIPEAIPQTISLGSISPELKSIETYYTNTINYELSQLELTAENKEIFDGYLTKLGELTKEYKTLTKELNKSVNDNTISALIGNLQLRLQLLKRMQKQLQQFKNPTKDESQNII